MFKLPITTIFAIDYPLYAKAMKQMAAMYRMTIQSRANHAPRGAPANSRHTKTPQEAAIKGAD
jgi:hypothetical protein